MQNRFVFLIWCSFDLAFNTISIIWSSMDHWIYLHGLCFICLLYQLTVTKQMFYGVFIQYK